MTPPPNPWHVTEIGGARVQQSAAEISLTLTPGSAAIYHDAQISDYSATVRDFGHAPPLRLEVRARASSEICGTAGFGFWNHAFVPGERGFRRPQALWFFFGGGANDIALAKGVVGKGWKAATIDARNWRFCALLPFAPLGFLLMRNRSLYDALWPLGQAAIGVKEAALAPDLLDAFHTYSIEWRQNSAIFSVDGEVVLRAQKVPGNRLGFIAWIDNQYAVVKPQGKFGHGTLDIPHEQSLHLKQISIMGL